MKRAIRELPSRLQYLVAHPAFRRSPLRVALRAVAWEFVKLRGRPVTIAIHDGQRMSLVPPKSRHGHTGLVYVFREYYEPSVLHAIDEYVREGNTVFDIGANVGLWALRLAEKVGVAGTVHAFEPVPSTIRQLEVNLGLSAATNVVVSTVGLSDRTGEDTIHVPVGAAGRASLAPETGDDVAFTITLRTLDDVWRELGEPRVPFVKVDIEGAEPLMLAGGRRFFSEQLPVTACEINSVKLGRLGATAEDVFAPFLALGYSALRWSEQHEAFVGDDSRVDGDVLFMPPTART